MITFRRASATVPGSDFRVVMLGDSITAFGWYNFFASQVELGQISHAPGLPPPGPSPSNGARPTASHIWFNSGVAGDDCITILAATIAARVTAYLPDMVIVFIGINCWQHLDANGTPTDGECTTNHALILSQIKAQNPAAQILVMGPLCKGENWPDGANTGQDPGINAKNAICSATALAAGVTFVDLRPSFFAYEAINNPTHLQILGPLTDADSIAVHPNDVGRQFLADVVLPFVTYE